MKKRRNYFEIKKMNIKFNNKEMCLDSPLPFSALNIPFRSF